MTHRGHLEKSYLQNGNVRFSPVHNVAIMRLNKTVMISLAILTLPAVAWPKGETTQIEIEGADLASPIEITDPAIVSKFSIWNGPLLRISIGQSR